MLKLQDRKQIIDCLACVLTYGFNEKYSYDAIEEKMCSSRFIYNLENGYFAYGSSTESVISDVYNVTNVEGDISFKCLFIAEAYFELFIEINRSFQYLFLYMPLSFLAEKYDVYHEMDYSAVIDDFKKEVSRTTLFKKLCFKKGLKYTEISSLTGISLNTLEKYSRDDKFLFSTSYEKIYKLCNLFRVKENIFVSSLAVYMDESAYHFDKSDIKYRSYLGLYFANYFDSRVNDEKFVYDEENKIFNSSANSFNIKIIIQETKEVSIDDVNIEVTEDTYVIFFDFLNNYHELEDYQYLKNLKCIEIMVVTQENAFILKKNLKREITDTINRSLIMRAKMEIGAENEY